MGRAAKIKVEADTSDVRGQIERATRTRPASVEVDADTGEAVREVGALRAFIAAIGDKKITVTADTRPAVAAAAALTAGLGAGGQAIDRFNRYAQTLRNVAQVAARVGILSLVGALAPLVGMATVAAGALGVLVVAFGLLAGPAAMSASALTNHQAASEGLETAMDAEADAADNVRQSQEDLARTEESAAASVEAAYEARVQAAESLRRSEITSQEAISDARKRVTDQARALEEAERSRARGIREATAEYRTTLRDLDGIERDNAERLRESYAARSQAVRDHEETQRSVAANIREEQRSLIESERAYAETVRENRARMREMEESYLDAVEERRDAFAAAAERERDARIQAEEGVAAAIERAGEAAQATAAREQDLVDSRRDALEATRNLRDAQAALNEAMEDEPRRQADAALSVREKEFELAQAVAEYQEAQALGDTDRAEELRLRAERLRLELAGARDDLADMQAGGSDELNSARDAVEQAWRAEQEARRRVAESARALDEARQAEAEARRGISEARSEGAELIAEAAREAADLREQAVERVIEARQAMARSAREGAIAEREAAREVVAQRRAVAEAVRSGAREIQESWRGVQEANRGIASTIRENAEALAEGQARAAESFWGIAEARRQGNAEVVAQERALAEAVTQQQRTIRQARWDIADQRTALARANEDYRQSQVGADRDIRASQERVIDAEKELAKATEATAEAAAEQGAKLTQSQAALLAAALAFGAAYSAAFAPAQDVLNYLAIDVMALATEALPYLGEIARQTALALTRVFAEMEGIWTGGGQIALFKQFFDAVPGVTEDLLGGVLKLGTAILNVLAAAMPHVEDLSSWWDETMGGFLAWTQSSGGQNALAEFFADVAWWAGVLKDVVADVAVFLYRVGTSEGAKLMFANLARFIDLIANNPEGITAALRVLGSIGWVIGQLISIVPGLGPATAIVGGFVATLALFGGGSMLASIIAMWATRRALSALLSSLLDRPIRIPSITQMFVRLGRRGIAPLGRLARGAANAVVRAFGWMGRGIWRTLAGIPRMAGRAFGGLGRLALRGTQALLRPFVRLPGQVWRALLSVPRLVGRTFGSLPGIASRGAMGIGRGVMWALRGIGGWFSPLVRWIGGRGILSGLLRALGPRAALLLGGPGGWLVTALSFLIGPFVRMGTYFQFEFMPRLRALFGALFGPRAMLLSELENFRQTLFNMPFFGGILKQASNLGESLARWARGLGPWLSGLFEWIGETMVWGWISGLASKARDLYDYLIEMAKSALGYVRNALGIASPSKPMIWQGEMMGEGLIEGGRRKIAGIRAMAREMALAATMEIAPINVPAARIAMPQASSVPSAAAIRARIEGEVERRLARTPGIGQPISVTVPVEIGGKRVDEYIIDVVDGTAIARRRKPNVPQGSFA